MIARALWLVALLLTAAACERVPMSAEKINWGGSVAALELIRNVGGGGNVVTKRELVRIKLPRTTDVTVYLNIEPMVSNVSTFAFLAEITWGSQGGSSLTEEVQIPVRGVALHYVASELFVRVWTMTTGPNPDPNVRISATATLGRPSESYVPLGAHWDSPSGGSGALPLSVPKWAINMIPLVGAAVPSGAAGASAPIDPTLINVQCGTQTAANTYTWSTPLNFTLDQIQRSGGKLPLDPLVNAVRFVNHTPLGGMHFQTCGGYDLRR